MSYKDLFDEKYYKKFLTKIAKILVEKENLKSIDDKIEYFRCNIVTWPNYRKGKHSFLSAYVWSKEDTQELRKNIIEVLTKKMCK